MMFNHVSKNQKLNFFSLLWVGIFILISLPTPVFCRDTRVVEVYPGVDNNHNNIHDLLEKKVKENQAISVTRDGKEYLDLIVCLDSSPEAVHFNAVNQSGGIVVTTWKDALYGMHVLLPAAQLSSYVKNNPQVVYVKENGKVSAHLAFSTQQIRTRDIWRGTNYLRGYTGNSTHRVATIDTGIDTSHSDLDVALYYNFNNTEPIPYIGWDGHGHGTHVTGIIAGKGTAGGLEDFHMSYTRSFSTTSYYGYFHYFPVNIDNTWKAITAKLYWDTGGYCFFGFLDATSNYFNMTYDITAPGMISCLTTNLLEKPLMAFPGPEDTPPTSDPYYLGIDVPYKAIDEFNLLRGMAPNVQSVALRVLGDTGWGSDAEVNSAFDWLVSNCSTYKIIAANASLGSSYQNSGGRDPVAETAVNNAVNAGCTIVLSAGNDQSISENIGEPAYSANAITVAAISNLNKITSYSSLGVSTETIIKPDVSAPGGSSKTRRGIVSTDSNNIGKNVSIASTTNISLNDYVSMNGTSMASPHVAGLAALIADAKGTWQFGSNQDPFYVKNIILMTAWECAMGESAVPPLNRGGKDLTEGYGRVNPDACIEAVTMDYLWEHATTATLGSGNTDKKVWARNVRLTVGVVTVTLQNPASADYDVFLYRGAPDSIGQPVILAADTSTTAGTTDLLIYTSTSSQSAYLVVKQVTGSGMFTINSLGQNPPAVSNLPYIKLFINQSFSPAFNLEDYNTGGKANTYAAISSFLGLSTLSGSTVSQASYSSTATGKNRYLISNSYGASTSFNKVKYTRYKIQKFPKMGLTAGQSMTLNLLNYTSTSTGKAIAPSFGNPTALVISTPSLVTATWVNSTVLQVSALSGFTTGNGVYIDIIASPNSNPPYIADIDKERLWIYPNLLKNGTFNSASDTSSWVYQTPGDKPVLAVVNYYSTVTDKGGTAASGVIGFTFNTTASGVKGTPSFSNMILGEKNAWYVSRMRAFSPNTGNVHQFQNWIYNGIVPGNPHIDVAANVLFGTPTVWTWIDIPMYTQDTGPIYPQILLKSGTTVPGTVYIDEVQLIKAVPALLETRAKSTLGYPYENFYSMSSLAMGWDTTQMYGGAVVGSKPNFVVSGGALYLDFAGASTTGNTQKGIKFTARNNLGAGIPYTPATNPNYEVGLKMNVAKFNGSFNTYNALLYMACYGVSSVGQTNFFDPPGQLIGSGEFGRISNGTHYVVGPGRNPYHQFQFAFKDAVSEIISFSKVDFIRDLDEPNFGYSELF